MRQQFLDDPTNDIGALTSEPLDSQEASNGLRQRLFYYAELILDYIENRHYNGYWFFCRPTVENSAKACARF